jgi:hypothetical protein
MRRFSPEMAARAEQESREWLYTCPECGTVRQLGGIRYKVRPRAPSAACTTPTRGTNRWHSLERHRPTDADTDAT